MDEQVRSVAWAIAEAWWRKHHRQTGGVVPEADSPADYADRFWQGWAEEARAAVAAAVAHSHSPPEPQGRPGTLNGNGESLAARLERG